MRIREIIVEKGILATALGGIARGAGRVLEPTAAKQSAKAAEKAAKVAQFEKDISTIGSVLGNWWKVIKNVALAWGIGEPMTTTAMELYDLKQKLDAGKIKPDEYEAQVQYWLGKCVTQVAAIGAVKFGTNVTGKLITTLPFGKTAGTLVQKLSGTAAAAFGVYLTTPEGSRAFAQWFVGESFTPWLADFMRNWVGSYVKQGYDALTGHEDSREPAAGDDKDPMSSIAAQIGPAPKNFKGMEFDSATGQWKNQPATSVGPTTLY